MAVSSSLVRTTTEGVASTCERGGGETPALVVVAVLRGDAVDALAAVPQQSSRAGCLLLPLLRRAGVTVVMPAWRSNQYSR